MHQHQNGRYRLLAQESHESVVNEVAPPMPQPKDGYSATTNCAEADVVSIDHASRGNPATQQHDIQQRRRRNVARILCVHSYIMISIGLITFGVMGIVLITTRANPSTKPTILMPGSNSYIQLDTGDNEVLSSLSVNDSNATVNIYKTDCYEVDNYVRQHSGCPFFHAPFSVPDYQKTYFKNCSTYDGKCPIDEYRYLVKSKRSEAVIIFKIIMPPLQEETREILFLAFDDENKYHDFLHGGVGARDAAVLHHTIDTDKTYNQVTFGYYEMKKSESYYFFVIQEVQRAQPDVWFEVNRVCVIASYSGLSDIQPYCTFGPTSNHTCHIHGLTLIESQPYISYCLFGHYIPRNGDSYSTVEVEAKLIEYGDIQVTRTAGWIFMAISIAGFMIVLCCSLLCCKRIKHCITK